MEKDRELAEKDVNMQGKDWELAQAHQQLKQLRQQVFNLHHLVLCDIGILTVTVYRSSPAGGRLRICRGNCNSVRL